MRVNKNAEKQEMQKQATSKLVPSVSSLGRKAEGTRYGTFIDWRESSHRCANGPRYGHGIRDGRS
jgi:hypothetical protein